MNTSARVTLGLFFGAIGGVFGWFLALPFVHDSKIAPDGHVIPPNIPPNIMELHGILFMALIAMCIAIAQIAGEAYRSGSYGRVGRDALISGGIGIMAGIIGSQLGNQGFNAILGMSLDNAYEQIYSGHQSFMLLPRLIIGRAIGWMIVGGCIGVAGGLVHNSTKKIKHGALGGLVGGFIGGLLFEPFSEILTGTVGRMLSITITGAAIGASIALAEDLFKQAWVVILLGRNEGRDVILTKETSTLGRDELSDVGIFGDPSVAPHHATIRLEPSGYSILDESQGAGLSVNNTPVSKSPLRDGDIIQVGNVKLQFHEKTSRTPLKTPAESIPEPAIVEPPIPSNICPYCGQIKDPVTGACACSVPAGSPVSISTMPSQVTVISGAASGNGSRIVAQSGPLMGQIFSLGSSPLRIGRDVSREIHLESDPTVSRQHAIIQSEMGGLVIQDEGSSNGTYVNGARITRQSLRPGDEIRIGTSVFRIE